MQKKARLDRISRRSVLHSIGTTALVGAGIRNVTAYESEKSSSEKYQRSLELRNENGWSAGEWRNHLNKEGVECFTYDQTVVMNKGGDSSGMVSTNRLAREELTVRLSYSEFKDYVGVDMDWEHNTSYIRDYGYGPRDIAGITFNSDDYKATQDRDSWVYYDTSNVRDPQFSLSKDKDSGASASYADGKDTDATGFFGVYLEPQGTGQRSLGFDYVHTWNNTTIESVTVSTSGIGVTVANSEKRWDFERSYTETELEEGVTEDGDRIP